jgi:hypothetical protein
MMLPGRAEIYPNALRDLKEIARREKGWDGRNAKPASIEVLDGASSFLSSAYCRGLPEPDVVLTFSGELKVIWSDHTGWFIIAELGNDQQYVYSISREPGLRQASGKPTEAVLRTGVSASMAVEEILCDYVTKLERRDDTQGSSGDLFLLQLRPKDSVTGISAATLDDLAKATSMTKTEVIHLALRELADQYLWKD